MTPERDEETGKFDEEYSCRSFLEAIETLETATTSSVAEHVGCSYDLAYRRLNELSEEGKIKKEKIGGSFIWE